jgi:hypothetical protein
MPFQPASALTAVRKVKNLLTGMAPTDEDVNVVATMGAAGLQQLINTWMTDPVFAGRFRDKMIGLFRNLFQQTSFVATEDFKPQLLVHGGFDFGQFGINGAGDDAVYRMIQNLQDSFALTAWQLIAEGRPFSEVLTTQRFMMTTGLKSLYVQIEMPADAPYNETNAQPAWTIDFSRKPIPIEMALTNMVFSDEAPAMTSTGFSGNTPCTALATGSYNGSARLWQRLLGQAPRTPYAMNPTCVEHKAKPYFTNEDLSDWKWVTINKKATPTDRTPAIQPYNLPALRTATSLTLSLPRVGFYTTPAFLALWNTNDSNQHRVTANQTLLVALGQSFSPASLIVPLSTAGLDSSHSVMGSECYGCHKSLDPLRQFWAGQFDYSDRNDFPARASFTGAPANPRPATTGGTLAFGSVNASGGSMSDLGPLILQVSDTRDPAQPINRFALAMTQKLCTFANSSACLETDPEYRRIAKAFQDSTYSFPALIKELFSSPLVTGISATATFDANGVVVSIARRDQLCAALSNRLGKPDICLQAVPLPTSTQSALIKIAGSVPADGFGRGSEIPITATDPTLFFRAGTEMLCESLSAQVVDAATGGVYSSTDVAGSITKMVQDVMGYPPSDTVHFAPAQQILMAHYTEAKAANSNTATTALRSVFALACQSPTSLSFGL